MTKPRRLPAVRECCEETGLEVEVTKLLTVDQYWEDTRGPGLLLSIWPALPAAGCSRGMTPAKPLFFLPDELPTNIAFRTHRQLLSKWQEKAFDGIICPDVA